MNLKTLLFGMALVASASMAKAQTWQIGSPNPADVIAVLEENGTLTISGTGRMKDFPLAAPWSSTVKTAVIEENVTSIGHYAFAYCDSLISVNLPSSIISANVGDFQHSNSLTSINIDSNNANYSSTDGIVYNKAQDTLIICPSGKASAILIPNSVTTIGQSAFWYCGSLTSITIPDLVTTIGNGAFSGCSSLTFVTIPNSVTTIDDYAFNGCSSLTSVTIPNSVTSIGRGAFNGCSSLISVTIPNSVTTIGRGAFAYCSSLTSINVDGNNADYSSIDGILYNKEQTTLIFCPQRKTENVIIPNSVTNIENSAFAGCAGLTSVNFNATNCHTMGDAQSPVFENCTNLKILTVGNNVQQIPDYAFYSCHFTDITSYATTVPKVYSQSLPIYFASIKN